jgi:FHS family L-fucose permease-like MFS transporter
MEMTSAPHAQSNAQPSAGAEMRYFVYALFFIFGGITSLNDVIIPKLKELFTLSYAEVMLVQSAFFTAYFLISLPAAAILGKVGYMRSAVIGLMTMTAGCLLFIPASAMAQFPVFLIALFVLAAGITMVQVVVNPLLTMLGPPSTSHSRLTFGHSFNSVGTTIFPYVGALVILGSLSKIDPQKLDAVALGAYRSQATHVVVLSYLAIATALAIVAAFVWMWRNRLQEEPQEGKSVYGALTLLRRPRFAMGALCIFLYVGAEVAIGSVIVNYLMQLSVLGLSQRDAGAHVPFYWGLAMIGRFIGTALLRVITPGKLLAGVGGMAILLLMISGQTTGIVAGWSLLLIGLFNSIMFPTIFALASEGLGARAAEGSGVIATAIVGGAVVPLLTGAAADSVGLRLALIVPALCYVVIAGFGIYAWKSRPQVDLAVH